MDELSTLLRDAARSPRSAVDPAGIRSRVQRRRTIQTVVIIVLVVVGVVVPVAQLLGRDSERVLIDRPPINTELPSTPSRVIYRTEILVDAEVQGPLATTVSATGLSARKAGEGGLTPIGDAFVILTSPREVEVALDQVSSDRDVSAAISQLNGPDLVVQRQTALLQPDIPTVVLLQVELETAGNYEVVVEQALAEEVDIRLPVSDPSTGQASMVKVRLSPRDLTGADFGVPGPVDIPDQQFDRPEPGQVLPEQLADGTPIWVVGLDDDVVVLDARSPHTVSGLVGWCGTMPGFTDSPGAARFDSRGRYTFGPAPTGLTPYAVEVGQDTVTVQRRLEPPPRPGGQVAASWEDQYAPIEGSDLPQGVMCESLADKAREAGEDGLFPEDYRDALGWVQHDLSDWDVLEGQDEGWFRTTSAELEGFGRIEGDLLVRREDGQTVDVASPPGGATRGYPREGEEATVLQFVSHEADPAEDCVVPCPYGAVQLREVSWVTADGIIRIEPDTPRPAPPLGLIGQFPFNADPVTPRPLAESANVSANPGDLVLVWFDSDGNVRAVDPFE